MQLTFTNLVLYTMLHRGNLRILYIYKPTNFINTKLFIYPKKKETCI